MSAIARSVDSLQKIYAVIIALAIGNLANVVLRDLNEISELDTVVPYLPVILSFFLTIVPFYHGMNRHLDICYIENEDSFSKGSLIFDFFIFSFEALSFLVLSFFIKTGLAAFAILGFILVFDTLWSYISHWTHYNHIKPTTRIWAYINAITVCVGFLIYSLDFILNKEILFLILFILRIFFDYKLGYRFYFPDSRKA